MYYASMHVGITIMSNPHIQTAWQLLSVFHHFLTKMRSNVIRFQLQHQIWSPLKAHLLDTP